jgi:hypothetical protein
MNYVFIKLSELLIGGLMWDESAMKALSMNVRGLLSEQIVASAIIAIKSNQKLEFSINSSEIFFEGIFHGVI